MPARDFLRNVCPGTVRVKMLAVLTAVAAAPPKRFAGGGRWAAMHGDMTGWVGGRCDGPRRARAHKYSDLSSLLNYPHHGHKKPLLVVVDGRDKPFQTQFKDSD